MALKYIVRLHPDTFYLVTYGHHLIGRDVMICNKIHSDRLGPNIEIIGITEKVGGDVLKAIPKNLRAGNQMIGKAGSGQQYMGKDPDMKDTFRIKEIYKQQ